MSHWSERAAARAERLALDPNEAFAAGLRGDAGGGLGAQPTPHAGLRTDLAGLATLALADQLRALDLTPDVLELALVGLDIVRSELGSVGELGHAARLRLFDQVAMDAELYPELGRWLHALIGAMGTRADLDAGIAFLERTLALWGTTDLLDGLNARLEQLEAPNAAFVPGLIVTLGGAPLAPADPGVLRRALDARAAAGDLLPPHLDPQHAQTDKVLAFLDALPHLDASVRAALSGRRLAVEDPRVGLTGASGISAATLRKHLGAHLVVDDAGVAVRPHPRDLAQDLDDAALLVADRHGQVEHHQAALDALPPGDPRRPAVWRARNEAVTRRGVAERIAADLGRRVLAWPDALALRPGGMDLATLRAAVLLWEAEALNAPAAVGLMPPGAAV